MRSMLMLACLLLVLSACVASADSWTTQMTTTDNPIPYIDVVTTATNMGGYWNWEYALSPKGGATGIKSLTLTLADSVVAALVSHVAATDSLTTL